MTDKTTQGLRRGVLASGERFLASRGVASVAFGLFISSLNLTTWQAVLAVIVWVQATTELPEWLIKERALNRSAASPTPAIIDEKD